MPTRAAIDQFEMSMRARSIQDLGTQDKIILLYIAGLEASNAHQFDELLKEIAARCGVRPRELVARIADLAERGFVRVDGYHLDVTKQ